MKIKSINLISYGKFNNFSIGLSDGVNVIYGKNEAGKSTIMSFIRAMIYGFSGRGANPSSNERKRFLPWGGVAMSGEIILTDELGKEIRVFRESSKSQGLDKIEAIDTSGERIKFDGELFVGLCEEAFTKTFYIKQLQSEIAGEDEEIANKLINLSLSGEDDVSYHSAAQAITNEIKKYKPLRGSGGLLEELKEKISALNEEKANAEIHRKASFERSKQSKELSLEIEKLRDALSSFQKQKEEAQKRFANDKTTETKIKLDNIKTSLKLSENELNSLQEQLTSMKVFEDEADKIIYEAVADEKNIEEKKIEYDSKIIKYKNNLTFLIILAVLSALAGFIIPFIFILTAGLTVTVVMMNNNLNAYKKDYEIYLADYNSILEKNEKIRAELKKFGSESLMEYTDKRSRYIVVKSRYDECHKKFELQRVEYEKNLSQYETVISQKNNGQSDSGITPEEIAEKEQAIRGKLESAIEEKSRIDGYLSAGEQGRSLDIIVTEQAEAVKELNIAAVEYEALKLAKDTLDEVYADISSDFTPKVNARASEIISEITEGVHNELLIDKKYSVTMGMGGIKQLGYFSAGTADQVYLSVRLAVSDILFKGKNPIILDDVFLTYDEERQRNTLKMLVKRAEKGQQIIIFSCRPIAGEGINVIQL